MSSTPDSVVIDTQTVMDWLIFRDPRVAPMVAALDAGQLRWIGRPAMLDELRHVLGRGVAASYDPDLPMIERTFAERCQMLAQVPPPAVRLVCRDPDDQMFIDLAIAAPARWLISRDRAVLALAKRARAFGLDIVKPEVWAARQTPVAAPA